MIVVKASPIDFIVLHGEDGRKADHGFFGIEDGRIVASVGFFRLEERLWVGFTVYDRPPGLEILRALRRGLKDIDEPIYAPCNDTFPTAERLMKVLGFEPTNEKRHGMTVWLK